MSDWRASVQADQGFRFTAPADEVSVTRSTGATFGQVAEALSRLQPTRYSDVQWFGTRGGDLVPGAPVTMFVAFWVPQSAERKEMWRRRLEAVWPA